VLFSNDQVAALITNSFEPCWEMVRPVPIVRIDFGNGTVITRTLHGNIATYACTADGQVLDVLPGIYNVAGYMDALDQLRLLAGYYARQPEGDRRATYLRNYHEGQAKALKNGENPQRLVDLAKLVKIRPMGKAVVERPVELLVRGGVQPANQQVVAKEETPRFDKSEDVASWKELAEDTRINETARRLQIHEMLVKEGAIAPPRVTKWLYKEVLHADLDDPYLGLGEVLFATYPFAKEDRK
jgi:hypothetical protein